MKKKMFSRLLCTFLAVLTMVCIFPAIPVGAAEDETTEIDYTQVAYESEAERLAAMEKVYDNGAYSLYCDAKLGIVAYQKNATGEVLFTNPWDMKAEVNLDENVRGELMSQIILEYIDSENQSKTFRSYIDAALKNQITIKDIKNGIRVEYAIGERSSRILCPQQIEKEAFEKKILEPLKEALGASSHEYRRFAAYFNLQSYTTADTNKKEAIALTFPVCKKKNIDIYVCNPGTKTKELRDLEATIKAYCLDYSFETMDNDYDFVEYEEKAISPPVFKMALEYVLDDNGLKVTLPANGLRYDETAYRITDFRVLPYMGASLKTSGGYSFIPDGSGALYELGTQTLTSARVYGEDYALFTNVSGYHNATIRMPVFGQVETVFPLITPEEKDAEGNVIQEAVYSDTSISRGYFAIIEQGATLATITANHLAYQTYTSVIPSFVTRQTDKSASKWNVYASRRYTDDYSIRYMILSDDNKAQAAGLGSYYECSWMGMAFAYRDYLERTQEGYERLTAEEVGTSIPLYIETFGCLDTVKKVMSMPVTVSVPLTSFENIQTMYDYLSQNDVTNVNFKMRGYANGGMYADVPYKLKWERSVGGKSGFKDLAAYATEKGFGIYPDFDFVYTSSGDGGSAVKMKDDASRTIDNRYTTKRMYSATMQTLVSYYQMVISPKSYSKFYEKFGKKYAKFENVNTISLSTLGSDLNSNYNEEDTVLREEAKDYVIEALSYFKTKNYDLMVEGGNAFTWEYADHILKAPLDSSRYNAEYRAVPFFGVVLHGYVQFAGEALNMEGDISYAMLKAMENGASIYFILSYTNTELLKEDELLSQNYSVRYDIWQNRLIEIYKEINAVLSDVQTKLIIDHVFLDGNRVPTQNEYLSDIEEEMALKAEQIKNQIEQDRLLAVQAIRTASDTVAKSAESLLRAAGSVRDAMNQVAKIRKAANADSMMAKYWSNYKALYENAGTAPEELERAEQNLVSSLRSYLQYVNSVNANMQTARLVVTQAKVSYDYLVEKQVDALIIEDAKNNLNAALDALATLYGYYYGMDVSFTDAQKEAFVSDATTAEETLLGTLLGVLSAQTTSNLHEVDAADLSAFLLGNDATVEAKYPVIGFEQVLKAVKDLLKADGIYQEIDFDTLLSEAGAQTPSENEGEGGESGSGESGSGESGSGESGSGENDEESDYVEPDPAKSKYSMDNGVVMVTYGDKDGNGYKAYKSLILNFNDYTVEVKVDNGAGGYTYYTVQGFSYVVIYH